MPIGSRSVRSLFVLTLAGLLAACSLPGRSPEVEVTLLPTSTSLPTPIPTPDDTCLEGEWVMPQDRLVILFSTLFPHTGSYVNINAGYLTMSFVDGMYTFAGDYTIHADTGQGRYSEGRAIFSTTGAYTLLSASSIALEASPSQTQMVSCIAYDNGMTYSVPCDFVESIAILPPSEAPYRCSQTLLEIDTLSPTGAIVTMFFER